MAIDEDKKLVLVVFLKAEILRVMREHYKRGGAPTSGEPITPKNEWPFIHSGNLLGRLYNASPTLKNLHFFAQFDDTEQSALADRAIASLQRQGQVYVTEFVEDGSIYDDRIKKHIPAKIPRRRYELSNPLYGIARAVTEENPPVDIGE